MAKKGSIRIGCSGWNYEHWRGLFYPAHSKAQDWFRYYARFFDTVEINNTFYHLPSAKTFTVWQAQAPDGFLYAVKASRYITHMKKLKEPEPALEKFLGRARFLREHLGPILYQLPPYWRLNFERLKFFLDLLPSEWLHVFEFREESWLVEEVFSLLDERGTSLCVHDLAGLRVPRRALGRIAYVRLHGAAGKYQGGYPEAVLRKWWGWMEQQIMAGKDVYVYFNNDAEAHAVRDALRLKKMAGL